ncbi:MAG: PAS domain-containing protein [Eubacterium sp.]|nr:PAS domain-containing protein [Eubacterium sp.]
MKRRKLNRFFIYLFLLLLAASCVGLIICDVQGIQYANYVLAGAILLFTLLVFRFFQIDGSHYKRKMNKAKEKNRLLFAMVPELFTEEHPDEYRMQVDGDPGGEFGIDKGKIKKDVFLSHIHPQHIDRYNKAYRQMLAGAAVTTANLEWKNAEGRYIWCDYHMTAVYNDEGQIERIMGVLVSSDRKIRDDVKCQQITEAMKKVYSRIISLDLNTGRYEYLLSDDLVYYNYDKAGDFRQINENYIDNYVKEDYRESLKEILDVAYLADHLSEEKPGLRFKYLKNTEEEEWEIVEAIHMGTEKGKASQALITVRDL